MRLSRDILLITLIIINQTNHSSDRQMFPFLQEVEHLEPAFVENVWIAVSYLQLGKVWGLPIFALPGNVCSQATPALLNAAGYGHPA